MQRFKLLERILLTVMDDLQKHHLTREKFDNTNFYKTRDQRSPMDTMFTKSDIESNVPSNRMQWRMKRALSLQEGQWVQAHDDMDSRKVQNDKEWRRRVVHIATDQVGMTPHQSDRVQHILSSLPSINKFGPYRTEEVIVGIVLYVLQEEAERFGGDKPIDSDRFTELVESFDTTKRRAKVARGNVEKYYDDSEVAE